MQKSIFDNISKELYNKFKFVNPGSENTPSIKDILVKYQDVVEDDSTNDDSQDGGRKRKGNGHKQTCKCPICKNMRKGRTKKSGSRRRKTRRHR